MTWTLRLALASSAPLLCLPLAAASSGGAGFQEDKLTANDAAAGDEFGSATSVDGAYAVVGSGRDNNVTGAAYVFERSGANWIQRAKLTAFDAQSGDAFGLSVSVSYDRIVVGSPFDDDGGTSSGSAYVYRRNASGNWVFEDKLTASDGVGGDGFGSEVALWTDTIIVGAPFDDDGGPDSGAVYVFRRNLQTNNWNQVQKVLGTDTAGGDHFGLSLGIYNDTFVAGAPDDDPNGMSSGSAYVFVRNSVSGPWNQQAKLTPNDGSAADAFGYVALHLDTIAVGARTDDNQRGSDAGACYVFARNGNSWSQQAKLIASDGNSNDYFGWPSVFGDVVAVGSPREDAQGGNSGAVYVYQRNGNNWSQVRKFKANDAAADDRLGARLFLSGDEILAAAARNDDNGSNSGSAYVFRLTQAPAPYCAGKRNTAGCVPFVSTSGMARTGGNQPFLVRAHDVLVDEPGYLLYGFASSAIAFHGGTLCVKAPFTRWLPPRRASNGGAAPCGGQLTRDFNKRIRSGADPLLTVGQTVHAQWRLRDRGDPFGDSLTDAISFQVCP